MRVHLCGPTLLAPGLEGWQASQDVLRGLRAWAECPWTPPVPAVLPPAERRRAGVAIRLAVGAATAAVEASGLDPGALVSVFGSSNGDGGVIAGILEGLAGEPRLVSPTQFHASVHNGAAAYWSIGVGARGASVSLGCHDDTLAASLISAATRALVERVPVLLCVYDAPLPQPLGAVRPTEIPFAAAMVLAAEPFAGVCATLDLAFLEGPPAAPIEPTAPSLRRLVRANQAARALPLLELVARREPGILRLPFLEDSHLELAVRPC